MEVAQTLKRNDESIAKRAGTYSVHTAKPQR